MLNTHNVSLVPTVFPVAPLWWPGDWGHIPITLPWEVSVNRSQLVSADHDDAVWQEVYQKFLEQLAGGWDLLYSQIDDPQKLVALPADLARAIVDAGGFSFCAGSASSASYKKFLQLHAMTEESVPNQRTARATVWARINTLQKERKAKQQQQLQAAASTTCDCPEKISRAARRLGVEAQLLEATGGDAPPDVDDAEKMTALASAALTFAITVEDLVDRASAMLQREERRSVFSRTSEGVVGVLQSCDALGQYLPARFSSNMARLASRSSRSGGRD